MECDRCARPAVVDRPYAGDHLCDPHLAETVRDRFQRTLRRQLPRFRGRTVGVALSGGKDSAVALALTHAYFARRPGVEVVALTVDEGIRGYRPKTIRSAKALTRSLRVRHVIVRAERELSTTTDAAALRLLGTPPCSYCGVWRRQLLNRAARDAGADALVLGFNLDDLAQTVLMNVARGDVARIGRMAPHSRRQDGLVPRVAPLAEVPEREVFLYARGAGLPFDHAECPYAGRASRNVFRETVWRLEEALPGTRQSLLRSREAILDLLDASGDAFGAPQRCEECGEPSTGVRCRACEYRRVLAAPVMGVAVS
ncbi:MAG: TIGR00269 family protein [Thermoplasmata archaeon]|nr:TIGR00269 family protein [Thermoplasmata archaeon]MCI4361977.1 TIGR00269 family protein [Thermoplasmata archaeon]